MSGAGLVLPGSVSETALDLPPDLDFDAWQDAGRMLGRIGRACQWWIGDWLNYGERAYGEKYSQALEVTGLEYGTVANCAYVASRVEISRRRENLSWSHHYEIAAQDPDDQDEWLDRAAADGLTHKELRRAVRRPALRVVKPPEGSYSVLYVDPPWRYDATATPDRRAVENHYPTMELDELRALKLPAAPDSVLFMWATSPKLAEALSLLDAWAFEYRTCMVWVKDRIGMGYYARQQHELLLIAKRGEPSMPAESDRPSSVISAPRTQHSEKPIQVYGLIERMFPSTSRIELFARRRREGWRSWGDAPGVAA